MIADRSWKKASEDPQEKFASNEEQFLQDMEHMGCDKLRESDVKVESRSYYNQYGVKYGPTSYEMRKIPFATGYSSTNDVQDCFKGD